MSKWREKYDVHPAADVFPMMSDDELAALGEDIKANGLREPIKLMRVGKSVPVPGYANAYEQPEVLIDGRNRLEAIKRVGIDLDSCAVKYQYLNASRGPFDFDAAAYIISLNIHRRHLTKAQQAELIVAALKADKPRQDGEVSKTFEELESELAALNRGGRGNKNELKAKAVETAAEHGISKRSVERAIAKSEGKEPAPAPVKATTGIAAFRQDYLDVFSALPDYDAMCREWEKLCKRIAKKLDEARKIEDAASASAT